MTSNLYHKFNRAGHIDVAGRDGEDIRLPLVRLKSGFLAIVHENGHGASVDAGVDGEGFASLAEARRYAEGRYA